MTSPQTTTLPKGTSANELRRAFLEFFEKRDHTVVPSSPLVPHGDPTMLFTTAGMVQFKPYFSGSGDPPYTRAASVQKCLRLTDLENVGLTPRHDTFFEMLGNFSFGPREKGAYFKEEAIAYAWEFVTQVLSLPKERLYASVFEGEGKLPRDDEAIALWKKVGLPESRIVALGRKDNFWGPAGGQGACGPCSEIYFDLGDKRPAFLPAGAFWGERPGDAGDRYMEFWNLVFPQFDAQKDGSLKALPRPGIDTGMGIERLAMIVQDQETIFETDLFAPLVEFILQVSREESGEVPGVVHLRDARIIADHARALTFAIAEGTRPGNDGAGYVLKRLLRRAEVRARSRSALRITGEGFLSRVADQVVNAFGDFYPELITNRQRMLGIIDREETSFLATFGRGLLLIEDLVSKGESTVSGDAAFLLHDTYGLPIEVTEEIAGARGLHVDRAGFDEEMNRQRARGRSSSKFGLDSPAEAGIDWTIEFDEPSAQTIDYDHLELLHIKLLRWRRLESGELELVFDKTPCYPESGGQVADRGEISAPGVKADLTHVYREENHIVHRIKIREGPWRDLITWGKQAAIAAAVDREHRTPTLRHHTATHLLHAALRSTLGEHVRQAGSLVAPDRLRFDYTHFEAPAREQLEAIVRRVNDWVLANREVSWRVLPIAEAKAQGAMALFGEKYGAEVRMVTVDGVPELGIEPSRELCGGTHVSRTGDIGAFVVVSDGAIASGVRRIEALCGHEALRHFAAEHETLARAAGLVQSAAAALPDQIEKLRAELERLKKAAAEAQKGGLEDEMTKLAERAEVAPGGRWIVAEIQSSAETNAVRDAADKLRGALKRGAAVLAIRAEGKLAFLAAVTDDLVAEKKLNASDLVKKVAQVAGGSGGGKPHLALAGAKEPDKLEAALAEARRLLAEALAG